MLRAYKTKAKDKNRKESDIKRPVPEGLAPFMDPLRMHPPPKNLKASISAPIQSLNPADLKAQAKGVSSGQAPVVDVNEKVEDMLRAHVSLEGDGSGPKPSATTSKKSRWFSKIIDKVNIPSKKDTTDTFKKKCGSITIGNPVQKRLNESQNLNRDKVPRVAGSGVLRNPVAIRGNSPTPPRSPPTVHPNTLTRLDPRSSISSSVSSEESVCPFPRYVDPFTGETNFEDNLETGILKDAPDAASTPRPTMNRRTVVDAFGSSQRVENVQSYQGQEPARANYFSDSDSSTEPEDDESIADEDVESTEKNGQNRLAVPETHPEGEVRVKKHPSPGIEWLNNVNAAITSHSRLQPEGASQSEMDVLAQTLTGLGSLARCGSNGLTAATRPTTNRSDRRAL